MNTTPNEANSVEVVETASAPGWYQAKEDPSGQLRWFDGALLTSFTAPAERCSTKPVLRRDAKKVLGALFGLFGLGAVFQGCLHAVDQALQPLTFHADQAARNAADAQQSHLMVYVIVLGVSLLCAALVAPPRYGFPLALTFFPSLAVSNAVGPWLSSIFFSGTEGAKASSASETLFQLSSLAFFLVPLICVGAFMATPAGARLAAGWTTKGPRVLRRATSSPASTDAH